jgi:hypothetical protein
MDDRGIGFGSKQGQEMFVFSAAPEPPLRVTQLPVQWVLGALSLPVKRPEREANYSPS